MLLDLFLTFANIGFFTFGGGAGAGVFRIGKDLEEGAASS